MVLLTGANGQLGHDFQKLFDRLNIKYIATDYKELDITNKEAVEAFVKGKEIKYIINCAAYNNVDKAEEEKEACYSLNSFAPQNLAEIAKKIGAVFVTYSTDFVFDGTKGKAYIEEDETSPLSVYSMAKVEGEKGVLNIYDKSFVIRTSWVFGIANNNFNKQVINWSKDREKLNIVDDQKSVPTYSYDLAEYSWKLIQTGKFGLYHLCNNGEASKYDQAKYVLDSIGWQGELGRAKTVDFNLPAKRGVYTKLDCSRVEEVIGEKIPHWQDAIDRFLKELND